MISVCSSVLVRVCLMALCCCGKKDSDSHVVIRGSSNEAFVPSESNAEPLRQSKCHKESPAWESVLCELKDKCDKISLSEDELVSENSIVCSFKMLKSSIVPQSDVVDSRPAFQSLCLAAIRLTAKEDEGKAPFDNDLLINSNMSNVVPSIGKPAPIFKGTAVVNGEFKEISLSDYKGKYVVLFFYPLDFTFVCPTEIIAFSDRVKEFKKIDCEVIACSTDSHFSHLAWVNTSRKEGGLGHMDIPLLADKNMEIAKSYGVLKEDDGVAFRGLFIIDTKHNLRQATINDLPVGRDVDETLRLVQAFQFTDVNGEVCPAGWKPGSKTMKADPHQSKTYFASVN